MCHPFPVQCEAFLLTDAGVFWPLLILLHNVAADKQLDETNETGLKDDQGDDGDEDGSDGLYSVRQGNSGDGQDEN